MVDQREQPRRKLRRRNTQTVGSRETQP
jgi:hypothetical protein